MNACDISGARLMHLSWKVGLRGFLDGEETMSESRATSERKCQLGEWLYSIGLPTYGWVPEMAQLESTHRELHATVKRIVALKRKGDVTTTERELKSIEGLSNQIVGLLDAIDRRVQAASNEDDQAERARCSGSLNVLPSATPSEMGRIPRFAR